MHPLGLKTAGLAQGIRVAFGICNLYTFLKRPSAVLPPLFLFLMALRGAAQSIADRGGSRARAALRLMKPRP